MPPISVPCSMQPNTTWSSRSKRDTETQRHRHTDTQTQREREREREDRGCKDGRRRGEMRALRAVTLLIVGNWVVFLCIKVSNMTFKLKAHI
jgi:hypothetical protein